MTATPDIRLAGSPLLVPDRVLRVDTPIAKATYAIMAGERVVHLDCPDRDRLRHAIAVVRRLLIAKATGRISFVVNNTGRSTFFSACAAPAIDSYDNPWAADVWDEVAGYTRTRTDLRQRTEQTIRILKFESGPSALSRPTAFAHLLVLGLDDKPFRGMAGYPPHRWGATRGGLYGHQILTVGPCREWHRLAERLLVPLDTLATRVLMPDGGPVWGEIPPEVLLAGGGE